MSLSNQKRELWTYKSLINHADILQAPTHINMLWKCGYIWWPKETEVYTEYWYTSGKVIFHGIQEIINMKILFSEWPFGTTKCNEANELSSGLSFRKVFRMQWGRVDIIYYHSHYI